MATAEPLELSYYAQVGEDAIVFLRQWNLVAAGTSDPVVGNPTSAHLDIVEEGRARCSLTLGAGLTWDTDKKQMTVELKNGDVSFIKDDSQLSYNFYVVWDYGQVETIRSGTVNSTRVA